MKSNAMKVLLQFLCHCPVACSPTAISLSLSHTLPFQSHLSLALPLRVCCAISNNFAKVGNASCICLLSYFQPVLHGFMFTVFKVKQHTHTHIDHLCMYLYLYKLSFIISKLVWCTCAPPSPLFLLLLLLRFNAFFRIALGSSSRGSNRVSRGVTGCARSLQKLSQLN